jgi:copper chaperone CopZ
VKQTLELTVPDLCCADEAQQIDRALSRLPGISGVQTSVGARKVIVAYEPERATAEAIRAAIHGLGMTVTEAGTPASRRRRPLPDLLGWAFVSVIAVIALVGIVGERLGLFERLIERIPP